MSVVAGDTRPWRRQRGEKGDGRKRGERSSRFMSGDMGSRYKESQRVEIAQSLRLPTGLLSTPYNFNVIYVDHIFFAFVGKKKLFHVSFLVIFIAFVLVSAYIFFCSTWNIYFVFTSIFVEAPLEWEASVVVVLSFKGKQTFFMSDQDDLSIS